MKNALWKHPLIPFLPFVIFIVWFTLFSLLYPMQVGVRLICFVVLAVFYYWGYRFIDSRFYLEYYRGEVVFRQKIKGELSILNRVLTLMNEERSLEEILRCIVDEAFQLIPTAQTSSFVIYNQQKGIYEFKEVKSQSPEYFTNLHLDPAEVHAKFGQRVRPFIDNNVAKGDQKYTDNTRKKFQSYGVPKAILYIPIRIDSELKGYITLDNWNDKNAFSNWDLRQIEQIQPQLALAYSRAQRNAELADYKKKLAKLYQAGQEMSNINQPDQLVKHVLTMVRETLYYNDICVFLIQDNELIFKGGYKDICDTEYITKGADLHMGEGICGWVGQVGEAVVLGDVTQDARYLHRANGIRSELAVPVKAGTEVLGVINLESIQPNAFNREDLELMMTLASQLGIALSNLRHQSDLKKALLQTIEALARSIETKDNVTGGHCERMEEYALEIGKRLEMEEEPLENLRRAAILHDIGKIGVPGNILDKPGRLTDEEFKIMQEHPTFGANILREVDFLKDVAIIVEQHHERIDGRGYPRALKGEAICLEARIISVVDAYDAMTSDRPYRNALPRHVAIEELQKYVGTQFDGKIVDLFINFLLEEEVFKGGIAG